MWNIQSYLAENRLVGRANSDGSSNNEKIHAPWQPQLQATPTEFRVDPETQAITEEMHDKELGVVAEILEMVDTEVTPADIKAFANYFAAVMRASFPPTPAQFIKIHHAFMQIESEKITALYDLFNKLNIVYQLRKEYVDAKLEDLLAEQGLKNSKTIARVIGALLTGPFGGLFELAALGAEEYSKRMQPKYVEYSEVIEQVTAYIDFIQTFYDGLNPDQQELMDGVSAELIDDLYNKGTVTGETIGKVISLITGDGSPMATYENVNKIIAVIEKFREA